MHFSNDRFSNKKTGFSGPYVVWSLLGAAGEKKRENQMFLQDLHSFGPLRLQKTSQKSANILLNWILNFQIPIETSQNMHQKCYFSSKSWWDFLGISRTCLELSAVLENFRVQKFGKFRWNFRNWLKFENSMKKMQYSIFDHCYQFQPKKFVDLK